MDWSVEMWNCENRWRWIGGEVELWKSVEMNWWRSGIVWKFVEMLFLRWQPVHSLLFTGCQHGFTFLTRVKKCSKILRKTLSFVKLVKYFKLGNLDVDFGFQRISFPENTDVVLFNLIHPIIHYHRVFQIFLSIKRASHLLLAKQQLLIIIPFRWSHMIIISAFTVFTFCELRWVFEICSREELPSKLKM